MAARNGLGVHRGAPWLVDDTVYRWHEQKDLPTHKIVRLWKFQLSEVYQWVRASGADDDTENGGEQK